jgi:hypothetical protein
MYQHAWQMAKAAVLTKPLPALPVLALLCSCRLCSMPQCQSLTAMHDLYSSVQLGSAQWYCST